LNDPINRPDP